MQFHFHFYILIYRDTSTRKFIPFHSNHQVQELVVGQVQIIIDAMNFNQDQIVSFAECMEVSKSTNIQSILKFAEPWIFWNLPNPKYVEICQTVSILKFAKP